MLPAFQGDYGGAYLLRTRPKLDIQIRTAASVVRLRANAPFVTIEMTGAVDPVDVKSLTWNALQDTLDLHATATRQPYSTQSGERGYLTWHRAKQGYDVTYGETGDSSWSMSGILDGGGPPAPAPAPPPHHPALRFYRLSQVSDDLFDSYRNAYLAFECLISGESAKPRNEPELDWLIRVSKASFAGSIPGSIHIESTLTEIYKVGRLPLFHAKMNETFFVPQGVEREHLQKLLEDLTFLLCTCLRQKLGNHAVALWGSMSQSLVDAQSRVTLECDAVLLRFGKLRRTVAPKVEVFENPRRFGNLWARIAVQPPLSLPSLSNIQTRLRRQARIEFQLEEAISLAGVSTFTIELSEVNRHGGSPRQLHLA